jgi:alcohol dehydrogenase class IV
MVHAIEACTVKSSHPIAQANGLRAVRLIHQNLARALDQPQDLDARAHLLVASSLAGLAIDSAGTGLAHGMGHALGTIAGIHHGRAVALALDVIFPKNASTALDIHAEIAAALGVQAGQAPVAETAQMGAEAFHDFLRQARIDTSLKQDGLSPIDVDRFVAVIHSDENASMLENNCYTAGEADIRDFADQILSR